MHLPNMNTTGMHFGITLLLQLENPTQTRRSMIDFISLNYPIETFLAGKLLISSLQI